jgi:hypothetical protein
MLDTFRYVTTDMSFGERNQEQAIEDGVEKVPVHNSQSLYQYGNSPFVHNGCPILDPLGLPYLAVCRREAQRGILVVDWAHAQKIQETRLRRDVEVDDQLG